MGDGNTSKNGTYIQGEVVHEAHGAEQNSKTYDPVEDSDMNHGLDIDPIIHESTPTDDKTVCRLVRKIDWRLLPCLAGVYSVTLIDRIDLPSARIAGMDEDLGISIGNRYSILSMIFFIPYVIFQFPSKIIIRKLGANLWLSSLVLAWGAVTIGQGFSKTWLDVLGCRILLGALEAGYFPGCIFLLSCWYNRFEIQKRFSAFYLLALLASGFASILAYGLQQMDGIANLAGWRRIFIMEGVITCFAAFAGYLLIINFPDKATMPGPFRRTGFLNIQEAAIIFARIDQDRGDALVEPLTKRNIWRDLHDWKVWDLSFQCMLNNTVTYSSSFFLPIILKNDMGFSVAMSQILTFPPYVAAAIWMFATAWVADKHRIRGAFIIFNCIFTFIGLAMLTFTPCSQFRYAGVFLGVAGIHSNVPAILSYQHNNIVGSTKRVITSSLFIVAAGIGGVIATNIFRQQDAPHYRPAMYTVMAIEVVAVVLVLKNTSIYSRVNAKADWGKVIIEGQPGFRYTV